MCGGGGRPAQAREQQRRMAARGDATRPVTASLSPAPLPPPRRAWARSRSPCCGGAWRRPTRLVWVGGCACSSRCAHACTCLHCRAACSWLLAATTRLLLPARSSSPPLQVLDRISAHHASAADALTFDDYQALLAALTDSEIVPAEHAADADLAAARRELHHAKAAIERSAADSYHNLQASASLPARGRCGAGRSRVLHTGCPRPASPSSPAHTHCPPPLFSSHSPAGRRRPGSPGAHRGAARGAARQVRRRVCRGKLAGQAQRAAAPGVGRRMCAVCDRPSPLV